MMDAFSKVADQTSLQLAQWAEVARQMSLYQAGEVTGPGTLVCDRCGPRPISSRPDASRPAPTAAA
jgi:hypothetical protein